MAVKFKSSININDQYTLPSTDGSVNQAIVTDGAGNLSFADAVAASATSALHVKIACKNTSGSLIAKGTPVYMTGTVGATETIEIAPADASNPAHFPATGLLETDLSNNGTGYVVTAGLLSHITTSPIDGVTPTPNTTLYIKAGGGLTTVKPVGATNQIQNVGKVAKVSGGNSGSIVVSSILRGNDVPNLPTGYIWLGDGNTLSVEHTLENVTNVAVSSVASDQAIVWSGTQWINASIVNSVVAGTGISVSSASGDVTITNTAPDQTVAITGSGAATVTGTYPNFNVDATDTDTTYTAGTGLNLSGTEFTNTAPDQTVSITGTGSATVTGAYPNFNVDVESSTGGASTIVVEKNEYTGDGSTVVYTLSSPIQSESQTQVYVDGVYQSKSNYSVAGSTITFSTAPDAGTDIEVIHLLSVSAVVNTEEFVGDGSTAEYTLSKEISTENNTQVYFDGVYQSKSTYSTSGSVITFSENVPDGVAIEVVHLKVADVSTLNSNQFTGTGAQTDFTLIQPIDNKDKAFVFIQGVYQEKSTYSIDGQTLSFLTAPDDGYTIEVMTFSSISLFDAPNITAGDGISVTGTYPDVVISNTQTTPNITAGDGISVTGTYPDVVVSNTQTTPLKYTTNVISGATNAAHGNLYVLTAYLTLTLPASPVSGDSIKISNLSGVDTCIVGRNGNNIMAIAEDLTLDSATAGFELIYTDATKGWVIIAQ